MRRTGGTTAMRDHPQRQALSDELHARPPEALVAPLCISHLAMVAGAMVAGAMVAGERRDGDDLRALRELCRRFGAPEPAAGAIHVGIDLGPLRLKWERRTEVTTYTFIRPGDGQPAFAATALDAVPAEWLATLPGERLAGFHLALLPRTAPEPDFAALAALFDTDNIAGARVSDGAASVWSDFRIHGDGWGRVLVHDHGLRPRQAGRLVQRLADIETYRMLALLALPLARAIQPAIGRAETALGGLLEEMGRISGFEQERDLLGRITGLAAEIEAVTAESSVRFAAARAYDALIGRRVAELREGRIEGLQTLAEFMERRLAPAMRTCEAVAARREAVAARLGRASQLLRTRVELALEAQNRDQLLAMNRRARLQMRLQQTLEGLSIAAITYYLAGLVGYALKAAKAEGLPVDVDIGVGIAVVPLALGVWLVLRRLRRAAAAADE